MQPSTAAVTINNCYAHRRPQTSVTLLHWHPALRRRLFSQAVNPGNSAISCHVVKRQPPIAPENKYCKRKKRTRQKLTSSWCVLKTNWLLGMSFSWFCKLQILLRMQNYRYCFMLRAGCSTLDLHKRQVRGIQWIELRNFIRHFQLYPFAPLMC